MKTIIKITFWIILAVWISATVATEVQKGYGQICGVVLDQDNRPIEKCNIYQDQTGSGAVSDETGFFRITDLPTGSYDLRLSCPGYNSLNREITVKEGDISYLSISMIQSANLKPRQEQKSVLVNPHRTGSWWIIHFDENDNPIFSLK